MAFNEFKSICYVIPQIVTHHRLNIDYETLNLMLFYNIAETVEYFTDHRYLYSQSTAEMLNILKCDVFIKSYSTAATLQATQKCN